MAWYRINAIPDPHQMKRVGDISFGPLSRWQYWRWRVRRRFGFETSFLVWHDPDGAFRWKAPIENVTTGLPGVTIETHGWIDGRNRDEG
jgi:hypothetical protein